MSLVVIDPGKMPQCETIKETYGNAVFEFTHPKTVCSLTFCPNYYICRKWKGNIPSISQSESQSNGADYNVYSQSNEVDFWRKSDWPLVGSGVAHATCGSYWTKVCLEDHPAMELPDSVRHQRKLDGKCHSNGAFIMRVKMTCHRPLCPVCWPDWRRRQVARVKVRFEAFEDKLNRYERRRAKRCHGMISVPKSLWHLSEHDMRKTALKYVKEVGITGGTVIFHPRRERRNKKGSWYFSPHFHVYFLSLGAWVDGSLVKRLFDRTGWVFRNFGERVLSKSISYQLSHAGVPPRHGHVVTWFGNMGYSRLRIEKFKGEVLRCPWGHVMDRYGVYQGVKSVSLPTVDGYSAYVDRDGWVYLPKKRRVSKVVRDRVSCLLGDG